MNNKRILIIICILVGLISIVFGIFIINKKPDNKELQDEKWVLNGSIVTKGEKSFKIGDYYDYDESNNGKIKDLTDVKWKVMGVDESGNLLILSASNVANLTLGRINNLENSQKDYVEGISKLNELAKKYGNGKGAINARSITAEDVNKITGYDPNAIPSGNNETTYYWTNENNPKYESSKYGTGIMKLSHDGVFVWYDEETNTWNKSEKKGNITEETPTKITTLKHTLYSYQNTNHSENTSTSYLKENSPEFNMLYLDDEGKKANYWTADSFVSATNFSAYGYLIVKGDALNYSYIVYSSGQTRQTTAGVRVVVTID